MMEIKNYTKEIKEAMVQKQEVEKLQKELTFVLIGDIDSKRKLEEQITEKNNLLNGLRERIQTELETEKEKFKSEEELKKLENQLVKGQKIGIEALKKEIEESKNKFQEIMEELEKGDTSRAEELKQESEKLADKTKMLKKYEADMYKFAEYKSIEKNQQEYKEVSEMLSTIKTGKWLEEMNDMINPQKDDTQKDDSKKDDTRKDDTRKDDTKKKVPEMTEEDLENYRNNIYDWVANNTDGLTKEEKNNLRDEKSDDSDIKKKTDYEWHPELTEEQIDELWAEGIVPGSDEYRMKLGNFGINPENENSENEDEKVNLDINKKTGKCKITSNDLEFETKMDAADYTRRALRKFRKELLKNHNISDEDKVYIENIDPTIYKAYKEYDSKTEGKNQVVKYYYRLAEDLKLPIFILLDKDAQDNLEEIKLKLRTIDKFHILKCGEFEDLLPTALIKRTLKGEIDNISILDNEIFTQELSKAKILEEIFKTRGMHEFKKVEFANMVKKYIKNKNDISPEIKQIIDEIGKK